MLRIKVPGTVHARLGAQAETVLNEAKFAGNDLTGVMEADIGTPDANRRPYHLHLGLKHRGESTCGAVGVMSLLTTRSSVRTYRVELKEG
jgi:hypothetical protein